MGIERCLSALYEAALSPEHWQEAAGDISRVLGAGVTLIQASYGSFADGQIWMHDLDPETYRHSPPELLTPQHNPGIRAILESPGRMVDRRQFLPNSMMNGHPITRQFFQPNRVRHMLIGLAQADEEVGSIFVLTRRDNQAEFNGGEAAQAQRLAGHVGRAMRLHRSLRLAEAQITAFGTAIERLGQAVLLVDGDLRILHANARCEAMLATQDGIYRWRSQLRLSDPRAQRTLEQVVRRLTHGAPPAGDIRVRSVRPRGRPIWITAQPALGDAVAGLSPRGRALLLISDPARESPGPEALRRSFGLTPAEARVAALAARPMPVSEIAAHIGVTENTIKTQIKAAYQKTGATSRAEFVQLLRHSSGA